MQIYTLISVIILILSATTVLNSACERMCIRGMLPVLCAFIMLALSGMNYAPFPEFEINFAALLLPLPLLISTRESSPLTAVQGLGIAALSIAGCVAMLLFEGAGLSAVGGIMVGLSAACMGRSADALFSASIIPLASSILFCVYEYGAAGYAACTLGTVQVMNAQMIALITVLMLFALPHVKKDGVISDG